jgi:hypothetical protein
MIKYITAAMFMGVMVEALAYALALWLYRIAWMRIVNVTLVFGLVFGGMAWMLRKEELWIQMAAGAVVGVLIEILNDSLLKIWHFPGDPWTFLKGRPAVIGVGLSWALVPPIVGWFAMSMG